MERIKKHEKEKRRRARRKSPPRASRVIKLQLPNGTPAVKQKSQKTIKISQEEKNRLKEFFLEQKKGLIPVFS